MRKQRFLAVLLAMIMTLGLMPATALAQDGEREVSTRQELRAALEDETVSVINMGEEAWEPLVLNRTLTVEGGTHAITGMQWARGAGLISGMTDGTLNPRGGTSRAQAAVILTRFWESAR